MPTFDIRGADGKVYEVTGPEGATREQAEAYARANMGGATPTPAKAPASKPDNLGVVPGAIADTLGLTDRPGARTVADVALRPGQGIVNDEFGGWQGTAERVANVAATAAPIMKAGQLAAKVAPAALKGAAAIGGRIAASAGKGAGEAAYQGGDPGYAALVDGAVAGLMEGAAGLAGSGMKVGPVKVGLKEWGAPARAFDWATGAPAKALEMVQARLPAGKWLNVPSLDSARLSAKEAIERLAQTAGPKYQQARAELVHELNRLDMQRLTGPKPLAGAVVRKNTSPDLFPPSAKARVAEGTRKAVTSEATRAAVDSAGTQDLEGGAPVGALAIPAAQSFAGSAMRLFR